MNVSIFKYCLHLADNALILAQRNSEWCAHGPVLEQDIAITNISLDLLGQARNFYEYAASLYNNFSIGEKSNAEALIPKPWTAFNRELNEDDLAFLREERQYLNLLITEQPNGDWAQTTLRQFIFSVYQQLLYTELVNSKDTQIAAIAEKSLKEVTYHLRWSSEWVIRLGDGTEESNRRMNNAINALWRFTTEFFIKTDYEMVDVADVKEAWFDKISHIFSEATLAVPKEMDSGFQTGKEGAHTEHMGYILSELQYLQRTYPNATW
jgi:ring-1,2-phenylacetyl-CoA epoxidase subunit PaaC